MKHPRKLIIWIISIVAIIALILVAAFAAWTATADGTKNYTGVKLDAAQKALVWDISAYSPNPLVSFTKAHVEKVEPTTSEEMNSGGLQCNVGPDDPAYYSVTIQRVWLFGITLDKKTYKVCNIVG